MHCEVWSEASQALDTGLIPVARSSFQMTLRRQPEKLLRVRPGFFNEKG